MLYKTEPTALLIDGPRFHSAARALGIDVDYKRVHSHFSNMCHLVQAMYFAPTPPPDENDHIAMKPLLDWLQYNGWNVVTKTSKTLYREDGQKKTKGNTDIELAMAAMKLAPHVSHILLCSGNGDFTPVVKHIQDSGTRVTIVSSKATAPPMVSDDLRRQADAFIELSDLAQLISKQHTGADAA